MHTWYVTLDSKVPVDLTAVKHVLSAAAVVRHSSRRPYGRASRDCRFCPFVSRCMCVRVTTTCRASIINTSYQKSPFGSGDDPDTLFFHQALNKVSNASDRELPRAVCWYVTERRWLPWLRVSKRSGRFASGCSEKSDAKDSKAVLSCERPEERSAFAYLFASRKR